jgi:hypothetical protein
LIPIRHPFYTHSGVHFFGGSPEGLLAGLADWVLYGTPPGGVRQVRIEPTGARQAKDALARAEREAGLPVRVPAKLGGRDLKVRSVEFTPHRTRRGLIGRSILLGLVWVVLDDGLPGSSITLSIGEGLFPVHQSEPVTVYLSGGAVSGELSECLETHYPGGSVRPRPKRIGWRLTWEHNSVSFDLTWERLEGGVPDHEEALKAMVAAADEVVGN